MTLLALQTLLLAFVGIVLAVGVPALVASVSWNGGFSTRSPLPRTRPAYRSPAFGGAYA